MEDLPDIKKYIPNYENLSTEEKAIALEKIYKKQLRGKEIPRTLQEIIDNQVKEKNIKDGDVGAE